MPILVEVKTDLSSPLSYLNYTYPHVRYSAPSPCACIKQGLGVTPRDLSTPNGLTLDILDGIRAVIGGGSNHWKRHHASYGFSVAPKMIPG